MVLLLGHNLMTAQKTIERSIQANQIQTINVDANKSFEIFVESSSTKTITVRVEIEGEYSEQMVLLTETLERELKISTDFQPLFEIPDNKLNAHKVLSIIIRLTVPENLNVIISSDIGSVNITGSYNTLTAQLNHGHFVATNFQGSALVNSIEGNITIASNFASVEISNKNGNVIQEDIVPGPNKLLLNTLNGNITVLKTK